MINIFNWLKEKFPGTFSFFVDFFRAMDNGKGGSSLRKWLAVGFFWLTVKVTLQYTDKDNLVVVLGILTGMITALVITYSVANIKEKAIDNPKPKDDNNG
jgi:hypothetical protein